MHPTALPEGLRDLFVPPRCLGCRSLADAALELRLCDGCRARLRAAPEAGPRIEGVDQWLAATIYRGAARGVVAALKRGSVPGAAATAAELIAEAVGTPSPGTTIVPVGAARSRRLLRGLDPAEEIALALGTRLELPVAGLLRRLDRRPQRGRPRLMRLTEPPRFALIAPAPERALLVDDVVTTGGTLTSCAAALRRGGSSEVEAVAFARATRPS